MKLREPYLQLFKLAILAKWGILGALFITRPLLAQPHKGTLLVEEWDPRKISAIDHCHFAYCYSLDIVDAHEDGTEYVKSMYKLDEGIYAESDINAIKDALLRARRQRQNVNVYGRGNQIVIEAVENTEEKREIERLKAQVRDLQKQLFVAEQTIEDLKKSKGRR